MAGQGRMYVVPFDALSVTTDADQDIFEIVGGSAAVTYLHGFSLSSTTTLDERAKLRLVRRSTTGSGGSAATEVPLEDGGGAGSAAVSTLVTTPGTIGDILKCWQWSQQGELLYLPTPELRPSISPGARLCLNLNVALAATRTWSGWVAYEEMG